MALSQHDLLRLLESLRSADGLELVRSVAERMLQELIEAEATARIGEDKIPDWMFASPINHVKKGNPPTLIIHGTADPTVDLDQSKGLKARLDAKEVANKLIWVKDGKHAFSLDGTYEDGKPKIEDPSGDVRAEVVAFFDKYLKPSS